MKQLIFFNALFSETVILKSYFLLGNIILIFNHKKNVVCIIFFQEVFTLKGKFWH